MVLSVVVFESLSLWPLAAAVGAVLTLAVLWFYPSQLRGAGFWKWLPPLLRWTAAAALAVSLLKPVILQPKSAEQWGAVVVLMDCSKSMSVVDPGRTPAECVALAGALGRLPAGARSETAASLDGDIERLQMRLRDATAAQNDLDYARVSGRGMSDKERLFKEAADRYARTAGAVSRRSAAAPAGSELRRRLEEVGKVPPASADGTWGEDIRRQIDRADAAAKAAQSDSDAALYKSNAAVRSACDSLAKSSRLDLAEDALLRSGSGLIARLAGQAPIIGMAIDRGLSPIALISKGRPLATLPIKADADDSDLAGAVAAALNGLSSRPIRAVVLMSDGRQVGGRGNVTSALRPSGVPVFTVGVAAPRTPDVAVSNVWLSADSAFAGETIEGEADVTDDGGVRSPAELHVAAGSDLQVAKLYRRARPDRREHGRQWAARFTVAVSPDKGQTAQKIVVSVPLSPGEATAVNNTVERWIKVTSDKVKVAAITAAPTWDFQYLRGSLARRPWVNLQTHLLDPQHPHLSMSPGDILAQDVLVLDDAPAGALNVNQWDAVHTLVTSRGGSVILIAGTSFPLSDYAQQPIARTLLPFHDAEPTWKEWPGEEPAFHFTPTPLGEREALQLGAAADGARRWQELSGVFRYLQVPPASFYHDVQPLLLESDSKAPVLTERRLGAGRVLFLGLDETWRWRLKSGPGEADRFWRQLVRHAAGEPYAASSGPLALDLDPVVAQPQEAIHVRARVRGAKSPSPSAPICPVQIFSGARLISTRQLQATGGGRFSGTVGDLPAGDYVFELHGASARGAQSVVRVPLRIAPSDEVEMRDISGDPAMLTRIARASGGQYLPIEQVNRLPDRINALHEAEARFTRIPLWNSPLLFCFVLGCLAGEWALRKRLGLA